MAKEKTTRQKHKQRSTKHTHKTKDRETRTPLINGTGRRCSGMVSSSCSISDLSDFCYPVQALWFSFSHKLLHLSIFLCSAYPKNIIPEKCREKIRLDFYVFITVTLSIPLFAGGLLVPSPRVAYAR